MTNITKSSKPGKSNVPPKILTMLTQRRITDLLQKAQLNAQVVVEDVEEHQAPIRELMDVGMEDDDAPESDFDLDSNENQNKVKWFEEQGVFHNTYLLGLKSIVQNWLVFKNRGHVQIVNLGCISRSQVN